MNDLNSVLVEGNLTADPETRATASGTVVCSFAIGNNRSYKKGEAWEKESSFFEVEAWGKTAESVSNYAKKGRGVRVVGRLKQERWEKDGQQRSKIKIVADHVEFKPVFKSADGQTAEAPAQGGGFSDDIPF